MKKTIVLSKIEHAAFTGVMGDLARARQFMADASKVAEALIAEIVAAHGEAPLANGVVVSGVKVGDLQAIEYEVAEASANVLPLLPKEVAQAAPEPIAMGE